MTRKDYILIAEALKAARAEATAVAMRAAVGVTIAAVHISDVLARDNPRFDRECFLKACGVQS
jgi:hypothetical protein